MKRNTIKNHIDFIMPNDSLSAAGGCFIVKARPVKTPGDARYGIVVSKRVFKLAVLRNRAKRLMRDWIGYNESLMLPDLDYIFILNESILDCTRDIGRQKTKSALNKIAQSYKNNE